MDAKRMLEAQIALHAAGFSSDEILRLIRTKRAYPIGPLTVIEERKLRKDDPRGAEMEYRFRNGQTLEAIGLVFGITRERVRQILQRYGISREDGGDHIASIDRRKTRLVNNGRYKDDKALSIYGCTYDEVRRINNGLGTSVPGSMVRCYIEQKRNSERRGIEWHLTLPEYNTFWIESGHWNERGRHKDEYCMARKGDEGAYELGNIECTKVCENASAARKNGKVYLADKNKNRDELGYTPRTRQVRDLIVSGLKTASDVSKKLGFSYAVAYQYMRKVMATEPDLLKDAPKGRRRTGAPFRYRPSISKKNPYIVQIGSKYIGVFPTADAATQAYQAALQSVTQPPAAPQE